MPILAFAGAPFTVASYLIEGRPSRTYEHTKALMHTDEVLWHELMERLAESAVRFIALQLQSGASGVPAVRLVGGCARRAATTTGSCSRTRGGCSPSSPSCHPDAPGIHFGIGCDHLLESMHAAGPRVIGLDWRTRSPTRGAASAPTSSCRATSTRRSCSPAIDVALAGADAVLADNDGHPGHIFNLGHGVHPDTDPGVLRAVVDLVHDGPHG